MTALDIMTQARERLGDEKRQRWSDNRLLSIISQGQVDICVESGYLRREVILPLIVGQTRFVLPNDCVTIKRVEYQGKLLPLHSRSDLDDARLEADSNYIAYKSNLQMNRLEIQPSIDKLSLEIAYSKGGATDDILYVSTPYGVVTNSSDPEMSVVPIYGCVTDFDADFTTAGDSDGYGEISGTTSDITSTELINGPFGVLVEAEYIFVDTKFGFITEVANHVVSGKYGISTNVAVIDDTVHIYYIAAPRKLRFTNATLVMPEIWEEILMRYVVGTALQDDNDANNIARGEAELQKYTIKLQTLKDLSSKDFSGGSSDKFTTNFRRV